MFQKTLLTLTVVLMCFFLSANSFAQKAPEKIKAKRILPGRWAFSFQGFGDFARNDRTRKKFRTGLGGGGRMGYGFWEGVSLEGEFSYDLLFRDHGATKDAGNKNLYSLDTGLRYTAYILQDDISWYSSPLFGLTFDYTRGEVSKFALNYVLVTGIDINFTENFSIGPLFKYRHIVEDDDVQLMTVGAAFTYLFD